MLDPEILQQAQALGSRINGGNASAQVSANFVAEKGFRADAGVEQTASMTLRAKDNLTEQEATQKQFEEELEEMRAPMHWKTEQKLGFEVEKGLLNGMEVDEVDTGFFNAPSITGNNGMEQQQTQTPTHLR